MKFQFFLFKFEFLARGNPKLGMNGYNMTNRIILTSITLASVAMPHFCRKARSCYLYLKEDILYYSHGISTANNTNIYTTSALDPPTNICQSDTGRNQAVYRTPRSLIRRKSADIESSWRLFMKKETESYGLNVSIITIICKYYHSMQYYKINKNLLCPIM
eukprot:363151_1